MEEQKKYDVIIIGSGLGGLLCGLILSKSGYKVCILEKHNQPGGNLQTFKRKGLTFSTGMHYIGSLDEGQILNQTFKYLGILDKIKVRKLDENCFDKVCIDGEEYCYPMGMDNFRNQMIKYFPDEKKAIDKYVDKLKIIWESVNIINLKHVNEADIFKIGAIKESAYDFINSITDNSKLKAVLAATNGLYAGVKDKAPMYVHGLINSFFINSAYKLDEREVVMADVLTQQLESLGGTVLTDKEVNKIICNDEKATAVQTTDGKIYSADYFISNIHPATTVKLAETDLLRNVYKNRLNELENSISCFSLYVVLKKNSFKHINSNIYYSTSQSVWGTDTYDSKDWPKGYILYTSPDNENSEYAESFTAITFMKYDEVAKWKNTSVEKRGDDYLDFKRMKAEKLLKLIEKKFPDIRHHTDTYYTASPLTYRDYTGTPSGSMYGIVKDFNEPLKTFISHNTKIPNLFLTGQNINLHGILGVTISSVISCSNLVDINKIIDDIKNA